MTTSVAGFVLLPAGRVAEVTVAAKVLSSASRISCVNVNVLVQTREPRMLMFTLSAHTSVPSSGLVMTVSLRIMLPVLLAVMVQDTFWSAINTRYDHQ